MRYLTTILTAASLALSPVFADGLQAKSSWNRENDNCCVTVRVMRTVLVFDADGRLSSVNPAPDPAEARLASFFSPEGQRAFRLRKHYTNSIPNILCGVSIGENISTLSVSGKTPPRMMMLDDRFYDTALFTPREPLPLLTNCQYAVSYTRASRRIGGIKVFAPYYSIPENKEAARLLRAAFREKFGRPVESDPKRDTYRNLDGLELTIFELDKAHFGTPPGLFVTFKSEEMSKLAMKEDDQVRETKRAAEHTAYEKDAADFKSSNAQRINALRNALK